jgi:hypothetical protein
MPWKSSDWSCTEKLTYFHSCNWLYLCCALHHPESSNVCCHAVLLPLQVNLLTDLVKASYKGFVPSSFMRCVTCTMRHKPFCG